jgi:hypothetical protein
MENCEILIEVIKCFMFDNSKIPHGLKFIDWCENQNSFIVTDRDGNEYKIGITEK